MAALRMPSGLARDLVLYCIRQSPGGSRSDALLQAITAAVCEIRVREVHTYETARRKARYARVVVAAADAGRFRDVFPEASPLEARARGDVAFRVEGPRPPRRDRS